MTLDSGPDVPPTHQIYDCFLTKCSTCLEIVAQCDCQNANKPKFWHTSPDGCGFCAYERGVIGAKPPQYRPMTCGTCGGETVPSSEIHRIFQICEPCAKSQDKELWP